MPMITGRSYGVPDDVGDEDLEAELDMLADMDMDPSLLGEDLPDTGDSLLVGPTPVRVAVGVWPKRPSYVSFWWCLLRGSGALRARERVRAVCVCVCGAVASFHLIDSLSPSRARARALSLSLSVVHVLTRMSNAAGQPVRTCATRPGLPAQDGALVTPAGPTSVDEFGLAELN